MRRLTLCLAIFAASSLWADAARELVAVPASGVKLDGQLDEPCWQAAAVTEPFLILAATATAPRQTRARVAFDRENIYVAIEADEPDPAALSTTLYPRDDAHVWQSDSLEIMLQPVPGSLRYFHFAFTPAGSRYDGMTGTGQADAAWNADPDWRVATAKLADRWQAEVAIPFKALGVESPLRGEAWGLKFCRTVYGRGGNRKDDFNTTWSYQPSGSYHDPMGWGRLFFTSRNIIANADFAAAPGADGLPPQWRDQLVWQQGQEPAGKVEQAVVDGRNVLRVTKFERAGRSLLPRASITSLVRGGRRFRATVSVKAKGDVLLGLTLYAGAEASYVSTPFKLTGEGFTTITAACEALDKVHAIGIQLSFDRESHGELLVRQASLVDEGPPPAAPSAIALNHGLDAACENLADMKPYELLRDEEGRSRFERLIFRDQGTGTDIWRITSDWSAANAIYSNMYPWNRDGSAYKLSTWERPGGPYLIADPDGDALRGAPDGGALSWSRDPDWLVYTSRDTLAQVNWRTGERKTLYTVPDELKHGGRGSLSANLDLPGLVYFEQAFGTKAPLYFIDLKTKQVTRLPITSDSTGDREKDWLYSAGLSRGRDGEWWVRYSLNHLPHLSNQNPYQQRAVSPDGKISLDRLKLDQPPGKLAQPLYSHGGTQPSQHYETGYSGGGICLWDFAKWEGKMLVPGPQDGHISWEYQDDWFFAGTNGRPLTGAFSSVLLKVYTDGTWYHVAYGNTINTEYNTNFFANLSPDGTKGSFSSTMLGPVDLFWCVISYPEPPVDVQARLQGGKAALTWKPPAKCAEIAGYNIYRSSRSGAGFEMISGEPIAGTRFEDPAPGRSAFYVLTSVERSGLESRCPSAEVAVGDVKAEPERLWLEAERGKLQAPVRENLHGSASNLLFVDHRDGAGPGSAIYAFPCRRTGPHTLWGRVRYQGGGTPADPWTVSAGGKPVGKLTTTARDWEWVKLAEGVAGAPNCAVSIAAPAPGFALDKLLLTDDPAFTPQGEEKLDRTPPPTPTGLELVAARHFDVTIEWQPVAGARYYQVYRGAKADVAVGQQTLIASPSLAKCVDWGLQAEKPYCYRVTAVDAFGNESPAAAAVAAATPALPQVVNLTIEAEQATLAPGQETVADKDASGGQYVKLTPQTVVGRETFAKLTCEFEAPVEGDYIVWVKACPVSDRGYAYASAEMDGARYHSFLISFPERKGSQAFADNYRWRVVNDMRRELPVRFHLTAGKHTLLIGSEPHRQDYGLDQIVISNDLGRRPEGRQLPWE